MIRKGKNVVQNIICIIWNKWSKSTISKKNCLEGQFETFKAWSMTTISNNFPEQQFAKFAEQMIHNYNVQKEFLKNTNATFPLFNLSCFQRFKAQ